MERRRQKDRSRSVTGTSPDASHTVNSRCLASSSDIPGMPFWEHFIPLLVPLGLPGAQNTTKARTMDTPKTSPKLITRKCAKVSQKAFKIWVILWCLCFWAGASHWSLRRARVAQIANKCNLFMISCNVAEYFYSFGVLGPTHHIGVLDEPGWPKITNKCNLFMILCSMFTSSEQVSTMIPHCAPLTCPKMCLESSMKLQHHPLPSNHHSFVGCGDDPPQAPSIKKQK